MEARVSLRTQVRRLDSFYRRGWITPEYYVRERDRIARDAAERAQSLQEQARVCQEAIRRYGMVDAEQDR